jgi:murein L,D-transpeptidase YcbB/YkuD
MSELLNEVSSILVKRVFVQSPDEDLKYIFTPSLQVMYMCMISLVSLKLIDLNLQVKSLVIKTEEQIKKDAEKKVYDENVQRVKNLLDVTNKLESMNFLKKGGLVYKVGSTKMSSEVIKLINNYFVILKYLPPYKFNDTNYDATTAEGVTKFQEAYGLKFVDGKIGNETKGEMKEVANGYKIKYNIQNIDSSIMGSL